jgi:hypothetical protein
MRMAQCISVTAVGTRGRPPISSYCDEFSLEHVIVGKRKNRLWVQRVSSANCGETGTNETSELDGD